MMRWIVAAMLLLALLACLALYAPRAPVPQPRLAADAAAASPTDVPAAPVSQALPAEPQWADAETLRMQVFAGPQDAGAGPPRLVSDGLDQLHARALAGDPVSMRLLGTRLHACLAAFNDPDASDHRETLDRDLSFGTSPAGRAERERMAHDRYAVALAEHQDCLALGKARADTGLGWLERAARAGDALAQSAYARYALDTTAYPEPSDLLSDLDEVIRRRDLADAWVRDAVDSGERAALADIANSTDIMVRDARQRALYALAWAMVLERDRDSGGSGDERVRAMSGREYYLQFGQTWANDDAAWNGFVDEARRIASRTSRWPPDERTPPATPRG